MRPIAFVLATFILVMSGPAFAQEWKEWGLTLGQAASSIGIDMNQVHARKDKIVKGLTGGVEFLF
jgi:hypothetical protein